MAFSLKQLLTDVFDPKAGEVVTVACDVPPGSAQDTAAWQDRRSMAERWRVAFLDLGKERGFAVNPLLTYPATGANNAELPLVGVMGGRTVDLVETLLESTLAALLTQFSATAPLDSLTRRKQDFRAASMPGIEPRMEETSLSADYREVARRCHVLEEILRGADAVDVSFSTGHHCTFDVRFRTPEVDDGYLPRFKPGDRVINLPSGETFIVPYEGEQPGMPSRTAGTIPIREGNELAVLNVAANRVGRVEGSSALARRLHSMFAADPARTNIAEVAFGCNEWARVTGNVLEDEKAGFHWAYGRSDHLGGTVGVKDFISSATVVHQDIVYAKGNPIQISEAVVVHKKTPTRVIRNGSYIVF
jgi:hypothetical protein